MNVIRLLLLLAVLIGGLIIGAANSQAITLSLVFWELQTTSGMAIICALLLGALVGGGFVLASVVIPLYSKLRRAQKAPAPVDLGATQVPPASSPFDGR